MKISYLTIAALFDLTNQMSLSKVAYSEQFDDDFSLLQQGAMMMVNLRNPDKDFDDYEQE